MENKVPKIKTVEMQIVQIKELKFALDESVLTLEDIDRQELDIQCGFNFRPDLEHNLLTIRISVIYLRTTDETNLVTLEVANVFEIVDMKDHIEFGTERFNDKSNIIPQLLSVAVGDCRGILAVKTAGTILAKFPLPMINVEEWLKHARS